MFKTFFHLLNYNVFVYFKISSGYAFLFHKRQVIFTIFQMILIKANITNPIN